MSIQPHSHVEHKLGVGTTCEKELSMIFDPLGTKLSTAIGRRLFHAQPRAVQNDMLQGWYDEGFSGEALGKALDVPSIYTRIDAHRGRGPSPRTA